MRLLEFYVYKFESSGEMPSAQNNNLPRFSQENKQTQTPALNLKS